MNVYVCCDGVIDVMHLRSTDQAGADNVEELTWARVSLNSLCFRPNVEYNISNLDPPSIELSLFHSSWDWTGRSDFWSM